MLRKFLQPVMCNMRRRLTPPGPPGPDPPLPPYNPESPDYVPPENIPGWTIPPGPIVEITVPDTGAGSGWYLDVNLNDGTVTGGGGGIGGGTTTAKGPGAVPPLWEGDAGGLTGDYARTLLWATPGGRGDTNSEPIDYMVAAFVSDPDVAQIALTYELQPGTYQWGFPSEGMPYMGWSMWDPVNNGNYPLVYGQSNSIPTAEGQRQSHFPNPEGGGVIGQVWGILESWHGILPRLANPQCYAQRYLVTVIDPVNGNTSYSGWVSASGGIPRVHCTTVSSDPLRPVSVHVSIFLKLKPECGGE
jgi:hypothetical protein